MSRVVVVGAGQAAVSLAAQLRKLGHTGPITLIGEESAPPYERPPLSKAYLLGKVTSERLHLRPPSFYADSQIEVVTGARVDAIDRAAATVSVGETTYPYDMLVLATGSVPRRLPAPIGGDLPGVFVVRTLDDVDAMKDRCHSGGRSLVIGGGYVGLEAAAVLQTIGMKVTVVEAAARILQRVAAPETSAFYRQLHESRGVDVREGVGIARLFGEQRVTGALLSDGTELEIDVAVVGIGVTPAISLASDAGLVIDDGIAVDELGRTSDPQIWSVGDCASFPHHGRRIRLESVQNAVDQATVVAGNVLGGQASYVPVPWFWSDQYDVKLQIAGLNTGYDSVVVRAGQREGSVSHWYYAAERLLSVDAMNDPRSYMLGKRLLEAGATADPLAVADTALDLKTLLPA